MLVGQQETCKVTDFGMARDVHQEDIYQKKGVRDLVTISSYEKSFCLCSATDPDRPFLPEDINSKAQIGCSFSKKIYQITTECSRFAALHLLHVLPSGFTLEKH